MSMNDPISDLLARLRNGQQANLSVVTAPASKMLESVLNVLVEEGYIESVSRENISAGRDQLSIVLKYHEGRPVIQKLRRVSTPGRRVYRQMGKMPRVQNGLGISILSTSKGVMSDFAARQANVGGEVLCNVF